MNCQTIDFVLGKMCGYQCIKADETPSVTLKVSVDNGRFFVAQVAQFGQTLQSKRKSRVRFEEDIARSQSITPISDGQSLEEMFVCSQDSQSELVALNNQEEQSKLVAVIFDSI